MDSDATARLRKRLHELTSKIDVRRATAMPPAELQEAATMLAQCFRDHPLFVAAYAHPERRRKACETVFAAFLRDAQRYGLVDLAYDNGIVGVLIAYPPGSYPIPLVRKLRGMVAYLRIAAFSITGLLTLLRVETALLRLHPPQPHYYCFMVGAAPGHLKCAGLILAKRLMDVADHEGVPIYLEAQESSSADVYAQFGGCTVLHDGVELYPGGPRTWSLWREPSPRPAEPVERRAAAAPAG
jgi:hypothetical protein